MGRRDPRTKDPSGLTVLTRMMPRLIRSDPPALLDGPQQITQGDGRCLVAEGFTKTRGVDHMDGQCIGGRGPVRRLRANWPVTLMGQSV